MGKSIKTIMLRGLAALSFLAAAIVVVKSNQRAKEEHVIFIARYQDWSGFVFFAVASGIACFYNLVVLFIHPGSMLWKTVIATGVIINILVGTSLGAGWQTYLLLVQGNVRASWSPIGDPIPLFCSKILGSLVISSFGFLMSIGLQMGTLQVSDNPCLVDQ